MAVYPVTAHQGQPEIITVGNPAAGANFDYVFPAQYRYRLFTVSWRLVADANVANRYIGYRVTGTGYDSLWIWSDSPVTAGQTRDIIFYVGHPGAPSAVLTKIMGPLVNPVVWLGGMHLLSAMQNLQIGDQMSLVQIYLTKWIESE